MLRLIDVSVDYYTKNGLFRAVKEVSFAIRKNEAFALVGESGCGKTTLAMSILNLLPKTSRIGKCFFNGTDLFTTPAKELRSLLGSRVGLISQNPYHAFDPVYKIGAQISEALDANLGLSHSERRTRVKDLLEMAELRSGTANLYPHELSGGMLQRAQLAIALCCNPELLIADEPTSSLDVTAQAQIIDLLDNLKRNGKLTLLIITHDFGVVAALADYTAVMLEGSIIESGTVTDIFGNPSHSFVKQLLNAYVPT